MPTRNFTSFTKKPRYEIRLGHLNCRSKNLAYLVSCKTCPKQYAGSSEEFKSRFNNYKCVHRKQEPFHAHFADGIQSCDDDWEVGLTHHSDNAKDIRKKK